MFSYSLATAVCHSTLATTLDFVAYLDRRDQARVCNREGVTGELGALLELDDIYN